MNRREMALAVAPRRNLFRSKQRYRECSTFTFPGAGRKVERKAWERWCASTLETRSASTVAGCWRSDTYSLCYVFTEHQLKPRLRDDEYLGEQAIEAEAYHHILSPMFGEACVQNASLGDYSLDFCQRAMLACACTLNGGGFLQNIVYEAAEDNAPLEKWSSFSRPCEATSWTSDCHGSAPPSSGGPSCERLSRTGPNGCCAITTAVKSWSVLIENACDTEAAQGDANVVLVIL